jgi:hypothetical protein
MCIDYRALKKITPNNQYLIPNIDDLLDRLQHAKYFTTLYFKSGYHQVCVKEEDTLNISFKTRQCLYEWLFMPLGLCNAPSPFIRLMNDVLHPYLDSFVKVYVDDILIYSSTWEEHISNLM